MNMMNLGMKSVDITNRINKRMLIRVDNPPPFPPERGSIPEGWTAFDAAKAMRMAAVIITIP